MNDFTDPWFGVTILSGQAISMCGISLDEAYVAILAAMDEGCEAHLIYAGRRLARFRPVNGKPVGEYPSTFVRCHRQLVCRN